MDREFSPTYVGRQILPSASTRNFNDLNCLNCLYRLVTTAVVFFLGVAASSIPADAQIRDVTTPQKLVHGVITMSGQPLSGAIVQLWNIAGVELASAVTDDSGEFQIKTDGAPGHYVLLVGEGEQWTDKSIDVNRFDLRIVIAVSPSPGPGPQLSGYTVSPPQLKISASIRRHIVAAQAQFNQRNLPAAIRELNLALKLDPSCSSALIMRAFVHLASKETAAALEDGRRATRIDSNNAEGYLALGTAHNSLADYHQAENALRQALALNPNSWPTRLELAKTWYGQNRLVLALRGLELLDRDFPDVHLVRANILMRLGRAQEGVEEFRIFLREAPEDSRTEQIRQIVAANGGTPVQP